MKIRFSSSENTLVKGYLSSESASAVVTIQTHIKFKSLTISVIIIQAVSHIFPRQVIYWKPIRL